MTKLKQRLYHTLRHTVTLMTFGALLFNTFAITAGVANAEPVEAGLQAAIQEAKLTASDGEAYDVFGSSIALDGDTALVGAHEDDDNGDNAGSAYIFERDQGGAGNWGQVKKLTPSDGAEADMFGVSVALSGDTALVGAYLDDDNGVESGSVYIFERDQGGAGNWGEVKKLTASDAAAYDWFGWSVAIEGDTAMIGSPQDDDDSLGSGSLYIFERNQGGAGNWGELKKLTAADPSFDANFGSNVALNGDTALVGAREDDVNGTSSGSAYLYERDQGGAGNWGEVKKITPSDGAAKDDFSSSLALSGDTALVASSYNSDDGQFSGSVYIFERNQGGVDNWGEVKKITASDAAYGDRFGVSVALNGDTALVGAHKDSDIGEWSGSAYLLERDEGGADNWGEVGKITASDGAPYDHFGMSVALNGDTILVGARYDDDNGPESGSAYIFSYTSSPLLSNLLVNGSFEDPLGDEWVEIVTKNGTGRKQFGQAYDGGHIYRFIANRGLELIQQTVLQSGIAGDEYTLSFYFGGKGLNLRGNLGAILTFKNGDVTVDEQTCSLNPPASSFGWTELTCTLTATGTFDSIVVSIGSINVRNGVFGVDMAVLTKTGP